MIRGVLGADRSRSSVVSHDRTASYCAFQQKCEKLWTSLALSILRRIEHNKTELVPKKLLMLKFQKDHSRTFCSSTNRKKSNVGANGVVGYVTERHKSIFLTDVAKAALGAGAYRR